MQVSYPYSGTLSFINVTFANVQHGVEFTASSPFNGQPLAFIPTSGSSGSITFNVENHTLNTKRSDGKFGLTILYAPPLGRVDLRVTPGTVTVSGSNQNTAVPFNDHLSPPIGYLSCSLSGVVDGTIYPLNSKIFCLAPGIVQVSQYCSFTAIATFGGGNNRGSFVIKNTSTTILYAASKIYGGNVLGAPGATHNGTGEISVVAGDTISLMVTQPNGSIAITADGPRLQARYISCHPQQIASVSRIIGWSNLSILWPFLIPKNE